MLYLSGAAKLPQQRRASQPIHIAAETAISESR